jgi:hypothetical protein
MLDFAVVKHEVYKRALQTVTAIKGPRAAALSKETVDADLFAAIIDLDPTPRLKYVKWILTRLYRQVNYILPGLCGEDGQSGSLRGLLLEFEALKHRLPVEKRDIFNYHDIWSLNEVIEEVRHDRFNASKMIRNNARREEVMSATLLMEHDGLSVHAPRSVEDVVVATGSDDVFDGRGQGLYRSLLQIGQVFLFNTGYGMFVGARPESQGEKGVLYDLMGECAMFEDALMAHRDVNWESCPAIIALMCKIDPALPFDTEMEHVEPYAAALNQFPLVLHEDRELPDHILEQLISRDLLTEQAKELIVDMA